jgi:MFS family permease
MQRHDDQILGRVKSASPPAIVAVCGLMALAVAMGIGRFAFTPLLPMMQDAAGLSVAQGAWLASANYAGYLLGALWATARRARAVAAIRAGMLGVGFSTLGAGWAGGFASLLVLRTLAGIASAWVLIYVSSWCLERLMPLRRPILSGAVFAGVGVGIALAGGICLAFMSLRIGAPEAWITLGFLSLVVAALVWPVVGTDTGATPISAPVQGGYRWTHDSIRLVFCYGAFGFGYIVPATFLPLMAKQIVDDAAMFGWAWPVFGVAAAASTLLVARPARILGDRGLWILAALAMAIGVAAPLWLAGLAGVIVAAALVGGTFMVITMVGMQEARRAAGLHAPVLMAAMTSAFAAGQILGPLCLAHLPKSEGDFSAALVLACGVLVLSTIVLAVKFK